MGNAVVHWELMSKEPGKVADFYARIFGWKVHYHPEINYRVVDTGAPKETPSSDFSTTALIRSVVPRGMRRVIGVGSFACTLNLSSKSGVLPFAETLSTYVPGITPSATNRPAESVVAEKRRTLPSKTSCTST